MFMLRRADRWRFILIRRDKLAEIRDSFERPPDGSRRRGRPPTPDADAKTDALTLNIEWSDADAIGWVSHSVSILTTNEPSLFAESLDEGHCVAMLAARLIFVYPLYRVR